MEQLSDLVFVVDPGHGGEDNGASYLGRPEKNDNLKLGLAVADSLRRQGATVLMTRDTDVFIPLKERADLANRADADLFISLHRNSYPEQTPSANGVENFIYLTAPEATSGEAAALVLGNVADVGVQNNRGVKRGNYYVLRKTNMPAMLLEMGYINNELDNQLFDEKLYGYADAIAKGALEYFGFEFQGQPAPDGKIPAAPTVPSAPAGMTNASRLAARAQSVLNDLYGANLPVTGVYDEATKQAIVRILQTELNHQYNAGLRVDGSYGSATRAALQNIGAGSPGNLPLVVQLLLMLRGYDPGKPDDRYGPMTSTAMQLFQRDQYLPPVGIATKQSLDRLIAG